MEPVLPGALYPFLWFIVAWVGTFVIGLLFIVLAARFATRAVLDEIHKDRSRRGAA